MPLPAVVKDLVAKKLDAFLAKRVLPHVVEKIRLSYAFRGNSVTIGENRVPWTKALRSGLLRRWLRFAMTQRPKLGCSTGAIATAKA